MPSYFDVVNVDLSSLTTAATAWEGMAGKFKEQEEAYQRDVYSVTMGENSAGLAAIAANARFVITLQEFRNAQTEAKAVASLLREAAARIAKLVGEVLTVRQDAIDAGLKVSEQGIVSWDDKGQVDPFGRPVKHDDLVSMAVAKDWQDRIDSAVKAVREADVSVQVALDKVGIDSSSATGGRGFNGEAVGDIDKYNAKKPGAWVAHGKTTTTAFDAGTSFAGPGDGYEFFAKAYLTLAEVKSEGTLTHGDLQLAGSADLSAGARVSANAAFTKNSASLGAEMSAAERLVLKGSIQDDGVGAYGRANAFYGFEAGAKAKVSPEGLTLSAKEFTGFKAGVAGGVEAGGVTAGFTADGEAGEGAEAKLTLGKQDDGKWAFGAEAGVCPGVGGDVGFEVTVDPKEVSQTLSGAADAVGDGLHRAGDVAGSAIHGITSVF
ncbi:hypothetical protein ACWCQS_03005 [Streptomyces sp. NPDC002076]